jgi:AAA ATPase domain
MLTAIRVGNFKAFGESQRIPLRPLTLIFGANSSGKSSILHSLILARHAQETGDLDVHRTNVGGESVDLGGFRQFVHRRDVNRRMEWSAELDTASFTGRMAGLLAPVKRLMVSISVGIALDDQGKPLQEASPEMDAYEVFGDDRSLMRMSKRRDGKLQLDRLDHEHPVFREVIKAIVETSTTTESLQPSDYEGLSDAVSEVVPEVTVLVGKFLPEGLTKSESFSPSAQPTLFPISQGRRKEDLAAAVRFFIPRTLDELISGVQRAVTDELARVQYLGPLRSYPPRHLAFSQYHDPNWYAGGGYAWDVVRKDPQVRKQVNAWLSAPGRLQTPYELQLRHLLTIDDLYSDFGTAVSEIEDKFVGAGKYEGVDFSGDLFGEEIPSALDKLKENESKISTVHELILVDGRSNTIVSHRDVGIGVSQVLPVLVGAYASQNQIVAIEQPEIHLHPGLQADLGDLFIQSTLTGGRNRFLIETHSEHLLLRVMRRIRETTSHSLPDGAPEITPEDVCVLFVEPDGTRSIVREMPLNESGELVKAWPGGFFEEGLREVF